MAERKLASRASISALREGQRGNATLLNTWFPCPLCGELCDVRTSKSRKPYLICNACGVQMFVRFGAGIARLRKMLASPEARAAARTHEALRLVVRIRGLREQKARLGTPPADKDEKLAARVLNCEIRRLRRELRGLGSKKKKPRVTRGNGTKCGERGQKK